MRPPNRGQFSCPCFSRRHRVTIARNRIYVGRHPECFALEILSGLVNCFQECRSPDREAGVFRCRAETILCQHRCSVHPRRHWGQSAATAIARARDNFCARFCGASRKRILHRAARTCGACVACGFCSSLARQNSNLRKNTSTRKSSGQNAAASAKDRRAFATTPRLHDPRGSRRDGGQSETRPRVKLDYRATAPRS